MKKVRFLGLDVHAETIAVAVAEPEGEGRFLGNIPNREESVRKLVKKLGPPEDLHACYEAGPAGYVLYWQLTALGMKCAVVACTLVRVKAGERVKTDRHDATKLARSHRAGDRTLVWVPDEAHEALRDQAGHRRARQKVGWKRVPPPQSRTLQPRRLPSHVIHPVLDLCWLRQRQKCAIINP